MAAIADAAPPVDRRAGQEESRDSLQALLAVGRLTAPASGPVIFGSVIP